MANENVTFSRTGTTEIADIDYASDGVNSGQIHFPDFSALSPSLSAKSPQSLRSMNTLRSMDDLSFQKARKICFPWMSLSYPYSDLSLAEQ